MRRRRLPRPPAVAVGLLLIVLALPSAAPGPSVGPASPPVPADPPVPRASPPPAPAPRSTVAPVPGEVYAPFVTGFTGVDQQSVLAADPARQLLYAVSATGGFLTVSNLSTGALLREALLDPNPLPGFASWDGLCLDPAAGLLFASFQTPVNGSVRVINTSTLAVVHNYTDFSPIPNFEPAALAFDPPTDTLLVQNRSEGVVALLNVSTGGTTAVLRPCPANATGCQSRGLIDLPADGYALSLDGQASDPQLLLTTSSLGAPLTAAAPGFGIGPGVYDAADSALWVLNSTGSANSLEAFDAATLTYLTGVAIPATATAIGYDPVAPALLLAVRSSAYSDRLLELDATSGTVLANDSGESPPSSSAVWYGSLAVTPAFGGTLLFARDPSALWRYRLGAPSAPYFQLEGSVAPVELSTAVAPGGADGLSYLVESPSVPALGAGLLVAVNASSGAVDWSAPIPSVSGYDGQVVADPARSELFVAAGPAGVEILNSTDGLELGSLPAPNATIGVALDAVNAELYAISLNGGDQLNLSAWGLSGAAPSLLWRTNRAPLPACAWAADPVFAVVAVTGCGGGPGSDEAVLFDASNGSVRSVDGTGVDPVALTVTPSGALVVANFGSTILTVLSPAGGAAQLLPAPGLGFSGVATDPSGRVLFATSEFYDDLFLLNASSGAQIVSVPTPSVTGGVCVDPVTGDVTATLETTGQLLLAPRVPAPSAVPGLSVRSGNTTLRVDWGASTAPPGFPVQNYTVVTSPSANLTAATVRARTTGFEANLTGLVDGTAYYVSVEASGPTGTGPPSAPVLAVPAGVPYPPTSVSAVANGPSSITVRWTPPADDGGANLTGFVVSYAFDAIGPWVAVSASGSTPQLVLGQLSPSTHYFIEVSATNTVGTGTPSASTTATTAASPSSTTTTDWLPWEIAGVLIAAALGGLAVAYRLRRRRRPDAVR